jgi:hypothetical protein
MVALASLALRVWTLTATNAKIKAAILVLHPRDNSLLYDTAPKSPKGVGSSERDTDNSHDNARMICCEMNYGQHLIGASLELLKALYLSDLHYLWEDVYDEAFLQRISLLSLFMFRRMF